MSVTAAAGWLAGGAHIGLKPSGKPDLAILLSEGPATVAGAFTTNKVSGAPLAVSRPRASSGRARGVVVSSGIANVATGDAGIEDARRMAATAAAACGVPEEEMLISSTGVIGPRIPLDVALPGIERVAAAVSREGDELAARAILTTDSGPKTAVRRVGGVTVGGMAKGAGMIAPQVAMATMLAYITTDAAAPPELLREILAGGLERSFNGITIDGCMSTSDTILLFANGASGQDAPDGFVEAVHEVMADLAYQMVADGEGATKVIRVRVTGALDAGDAKAVAREVAGSLLVRSAMWGCDPNWGRIAQAIGQARAEVDASRIGVRVAGVEVAHRGAQATLPPDAGERLAAREVPIDIDLGLGDGTAEVLTCDLTPEYVRFNGEYTT